MIPTYLASATDDAPILRRWLPDMEKHGFFSTARWLAGQTDVLRHVAAVLDEEDVRRSAVMVCYHPRHRFKGKGGRHAELGIALSMRIPVLLVGDREHVFHYHPLVVVAKTGKDIGQKLEQAMERFPAALERLRVLRNLTRPKGADVELSNPTSDPRL